MFFIPNSLIYNVRARARKHRVNTRFLARTLLSAKCGDAFSNLHVYVSLSRAERLSSLCRDDFQRMPRYIYFGLLFHVKWNRVPSYMEQGSTSHGTGFHLSDSVAVNQKALYKGLSMAFRKQMFKGQNN